MKKLRIYLGGPINGCSDEECNDWREYLISKAVSRYDFINPMDRDYRDTIINPTVAPEVVELDKRDIDNCDILVANITRHSAGTAMEMLYAWERQKVIVAIANSGVKLSPWHIYHSTKIVYSLDEALQWITERIR